MPEDVQDLLIARNHGWTMNPVEKVLTACIVGILFLIAFGFSLGFVQFGQVDDRFNQGQKRTYQNRAVACETLLALGQKDQSGVCTDKNTLLYYDPEAVPLTPSAQILCDSLRQSIQLKPDSGFVLPKGCR